MKILSALTFVLGLALATSAHAELLGPVEGPGFASSYVGQAHMRGNASSLLGSVPQAHSYQPAVAYQPARAYQPATAYNGAVPYQPARAYQPAW